MATVLVIAGHGKQRNGRVDPGAFGFISRGEHKYYTEIFFPAVKKQLAPGTNLVLFSDHDVYDYSDVVTLAKKYGKDTIVVEMHYDASDSTSATGGHIIVHENYAPDKIDLALRDVIAKHIGIRYVHKGHKGISGRGNLRNCNLAKANNINYRLMEMGFGTNKKDSDIMVNNVNAIARDFILALGVKVGTPTAPTTPVTSGSYKVVKGDTLWGIATKHKTTVANIKSWNGLKSDTINPGQTLKVSAPVREYTVKSGDSLSAIGSRLGVKWQDIASKNNIKSPYTIQIGQKLKY